MVCGLSATSTTSGAKSAGICSGAATSVTSGLPTKLATASRWGSTATNGPRMPLASHPASSAPPILPQPTKSNPAMMAGLCLTHRVDACGVECLARLLAAPDHELEGREEALALGERHVDQVLDLLDRDAARAAQGHRVAEHRHAVVRGEVKMPEPHALVGERHQLEHAGPAVCGDLEIQRAGE